MYDNRSPKTFLFGLLMGAIGATAAFLFKNKRWEGIKKDIKTKYNRVSKTLVNTLQEEARELKAKSRKKR